MAKKVEALSLPSRKFTMPTIATPNLTQPLFGYARNFEWNIYEHLLNGSARKHLKVKDGHYPSMQQEQIFQGWRHQSSWA